MHPTPSNIFADGNRIVITSRFASTDTRKFWEVFEKVIERCDSLRINLHPEQAAGSPVLQGGEECRLGKTLADRTKFRLLH